jgi:hypothetical protein
MYRNITIGDTVYRAELQTLINHRITIKDEEVSVFSDLDGRTPGALFEAAFTGRGDTQVLVAPEEYVIGDAIMEPGDDLKMAQAKKLPEIAAARYEVEVGGITVNDMAIETDRESRSLLIGAAFVASLDTGYTCQWKTANGFVTLTAEQIIVLAQAVRAHVQACFDQEALLTAAIEAATTIEVVEAIVWSLE